MQNVDTRHRQYDEFASRWRLMRDVMAGEYAIHRAGELYLKKLKDQSDADYSAYKSRACFYNATWRTIDGLRGMIFRKPPNVVLTAQVEKFQDDIDLAGTSVESFVREVVLEVLGPSRVGVMVDHPKVEASGPMTVMEAQQIGLRPMLKIYKAETIINWRYGRINNRFVMTMVTLEETIEEPVDEFNLREVKQWRVLDIDDAGFYRQRLFRKAKGGEFDLIDEFWPLMNGLNMSSIPFIIIGGDGRETDLGEPVLIDLATVNLAHYRTSADYEHGTHFTGLPTAYIAGYIPEKDQQLYIGSPAAWIFPNPDTKAGFLEFTGEGLDAIVANLDRKEQQMAILGARMIAAEKKVAETATTTAIHRTGENSVLASIARGVSDAMEWALGLFSEWAGGENVATFQLNRDYAPAAIDAQQLTALIRAMQSGTISGQSVHTLLQRADIIDSEISFEDEQERIGQQSLPSPQPGTDALAA